METKLPALNDLYNDVEIKEKENDLNFLLNQSPKKEWIKQHPYISNVSYIPIERIEYLLTKIFIKWHVEVKNVQLLGNSIVVTIRLFYQSVFSQNEEWQDGVGAAPLQTDSGAGAIEFNKLKSSAIMMAAPAAETFAIKDAAEKLGKLFGKDLNRKDEISYESLKKTEFNNKDNFENEDNI